MTWTLNLGSCLDPVTGLASLADKSVDVTITDPPYSQHTHDKQWTARALTNGQQRGKVSKRGRAYDAVSSGFAGLDFAHITTEQAAEVAAQAARVTRRWVLIFTDLEGIALWTMATAAAGLDYVRTCIWDKVDGAPQFTGDRPAAGAEAIVVAHPKGKKHWNGGGRRNVFRYEVNGQRGDKPHPTTKPLPLMLDLIELFSDPEELVLDPFAGSGSTGLAARMRGRRFVGWEVDASYHEIASRKIGGDEAKPNPAQPSLFGGLVA